MIADWIKRRQLAKLSERRAYLERRLSDLENQEAEHRRWWVYFGHRAYCMDAMKEPMRWGRMQNSANWEEWHMRDCAARAAVVRKEIKELEQA